MAKTIIKSSDSLRKKDLKLLFDTSLVPQQEWGYIYHHPRRVGRQVSPAFISVCGNTVLAYDLMTQLGLYNITYVESGRYEHTWHVVTRSGEVMSFAVDRHVKPNRYDAFVEVLNRALKSMDVNGAAEHS